ncbi:MAG: undecaprenyldiphospho-muramoylpentapeptide beta-N-acetylglucosaminyltransferase [Proteobacteria bacterium]|jgi:UDP-N-acetylglucosamine--N-acetylmuramyl-(pentapeptide) pyrophosphoryl-undecaprenol N-acetylglucosamine transferase|nr:undecaprenyldiphospho-muramoylpentapeptide beta-N-acetylglucosaminyltransferase [Pseudomonadales bacterium]MDA1243469.1 undecaprenyldiphospho-muramoylpentapeptide beta-N-acetylglucosaminyltransferase [Pseudomonadota bacterium]
MAISRVLIMAAGTGGHVFPALAIARQLETRGVKIDWLGTPDGMEEKLLEGTGYEFHQIAAKGLKGKGLSRLLSAPWMLMRSLWQSLVIINRLKPDCVLGMGGYVSGPGGVAARLLRRKLYLHEQNAVVGLTNRLLSRLANCVFEAFPGAFLKSDKVMYVGNPVRADIEQVGASMPEFATHERPIRILVLGGSQGALAINEAMPEALAQLKSAGPATVPEVRHQTGAAQLEPTLSAYANAGFEPTSKLTISAFIDDMAAAYAWADLVIGRSGASTVTEIAVAGRASILVPYPHHKDQQQLHNARWLSAAGAATIIEQQLLSGDRLATEISSLNTDRDVLLAKSMAAHALAPRHVDARIADIMMEIAHAR